MITCIYIRFRLGPLLGEAPLPLHLRSLCTSCSLPLLGEAPLPLLLLPLHLIGVGPPPLSPLDQPEARMLQPDRARSCRFCLSF